MSSKDDAIEMAIAWFEWFLSIGSPTEDPPYSSNEVLEQLKKVRKNEP